MSGGAHRKTGTAIPALERTMKHLEHAMANLRTLRGLREPDLDIGISDLSQRLDRLRLDVGSLLGVRRSQEEAQAARVRETAGRGGPEL